MPAVSANVVAIGERCVLCGVKLADEDQIRAGLCDSCAKRPEAKRPSAPQPIARGGQARPFTSADRALIQNLHGTIPAQDLLRLLNIRLVADLGPDTPRYTAAQLHAAVQALPATKASAADWSDLRKLLGQARRAGVLVTITPQVIDDFCTIWRLSPAQQLHLKDVIRNAQEDLS